MLKNSGLIEGLGAYRLPTCSQEAHHGDHQLSEFCMEDGCSTQLVPVCAFCKFINHKKNKHDIKPVKLVFGELIKDLEELQANFEQQNSQESDIERDLKHIAGELAATVEKCNQMIEHINLNLEKFKAIQMKEPYERTAVRKILREIFKSNDNEVILRKNVDELRQYTRIDEDGLLKVNDTISLAALKDAQAKASLFIKNMQPPLKNLEEVRGYLDVSMQQFYLDYDAEDIVSERGDHTTPMEYSKSFISKNVMKAKISKKEERKKELEKQRDAIKIYMDKHVDDQCDNKHCSFVDIPYKIKYWKTLWFKERTDCAEGKKLNYDMEAVLQELRRYQ